MRWQLISEGPYSPFHDLTFASPLAAVGCFLGKPTAASTTAQSEDPTSVPSWLPVVTTVIEALEPFQEASRAVSRPIQEKHPEQFQEHLR